jgi:ATP-dependent RNA helicase UAP56/SUB2
MEHCDDSSDE